MKKSRFTESQIVAIFKEADSGLNGARKKRSVPQKTRSRCHPHGGMPEEVPASPSSTAVTTCDNQEMVTAAPDAKILKAPPAIAAWGDDPDRPVDEPPAASTPFQPKGPDSSQTPKNGEALAAKDLQSSPGMQVAWYGYRYYNPTTGRWPSRDPIGERGGENLYSAVSNRPTIGVDRLGLEVCGNDDLMIGRTITVRNTPWRDPPKPGEKEDSQNWASHFANHIDKDQVYVDNWDQVGDVMKKDKDCVNVLNIFAHAGDGIVLSGQKWSTSFQGQAIGAKLKDKFCNPCQINIYGCGAGAGSAEFIKGLRDTTKCTILAVKDDEGFGRDQGEWDERKGEYEGGTWPYWFIINNGELYQWPSDGGPEKVVDGYANKHNTGPYPTVGNQPK